MAQSIEVVIHSIHRSLSYILVQLCKSNRFDPFARTMIEAQIVSAYGAAWIAAKLFVQRRRLIATKVPDTVHFLNVGNHASPTVMGRPH
jgi:hypothetical protein